MNMARRRFDENLRRAVLRRCIRTTRSGIEYISRGRRSFWEGRGSMGIVVVRSPKCLRGLLRRLFGVK